MNARFLAAFVGLVLIALGCGAYTQNTHDTIRAGVLASK